MNIGFYAGSFDPFTNGHLHVIATAAKLFDKVVVGIAVNPNKQRRFDKELMQKAIEETLIQEGLTNVEVISFDNLTGDVAINCNSTFLVRGIRNGMDYEYEENMAQINQKDICGLDTIYIRAGELGNISSSLVMELLKHGKDVSKYLPREVLNLVLS